VPGPWTARVSAGYLEGAVPGTVPEHVNGIIKQSIVTLQNVSDIQGRSDQQQIKDVLVLRQMDLFADGTFRPDSNVTREDFVRTLALNVPLRQSLAPTPRFTDVTPALLPFAEAATASGSTLRDWNFVPQGALTAGSSTFNPAGSLNRLDLAVAFVRSLGLDAEARAKANTAVTTGGQPLVDNASIPGALRGYVQLAIDKGLMEAFPAELREVAPGVFVAVPGPRFEPNTLVTRAGLALKLITFSQRFAAGN
jgi:serine protease AprX